MAMFYGTNGYNRAVTLPVNAICYNLTDGGDLVRGKPHTWEALKSHVWQRVQSHEDLRHYTQARVEREIDVWLKVNEQKVDIFTPPEKGQRNDS